MLALWRAVLDGHGPKDADRHHAEGVWRILALSMRTSPNPRDGRLQADVFVAVNSC
jgi:hypothetical protein